MTISPPGGLPYHPSELGLGSDLSGGEPYVRTGLIGILVLLMIVVISVIILTVSAPFILLGLVEVVSDPGLTNYRVRWIRKDP